MRLLAVFSLVGLSAVIASASPIVNATGLSSPTATVTFEEIVLGADTALTSQYSGLGVTFSGLQYDTQSCAGFPGFGGSHCAGNLGTNPFSVFFNSVQTAAAIGFATNPNTTTVSAYLSGGLVESFSQATSFDVAGTAFLGFSGISFDEIRFSVSGDGAAVLDNIQMGTSNAVPEPSTFALAALALGALCLGRRRLTGLL